MEWSPLWSTTKYLCILEQAKVVADRSAMSQVCVPEWVCSAEPAEVAFVILCHTHPSLDSNFDLKQLTPRLVRRYDHNDAIGIQPPEYMRTILS